MSSVSDLPGAGRDRLRQAGGSRWKWVQIGRQAPKRRDHPHRVVARRERRVLQSPVVRAAAGCQRRQGPARPGGAGAVESHGQSI